MNISLVIIIISINVISKISSGPFPFFFSLTTMAKWSLSPRQTRKLRVKVSPLKLEGICREMVGDGERERVVVLKMKWKGPKTSLVPFQRASKTQINYSREMLLREGESIHWDDEFERICSFPTASREDSSAPWNVSFDVLTSEGRNPKSKLVVLGNVSLNIAEFITRAESQIEKKLLIPLQIDGMAIEATLSVRLSFAEITNSNDSTRIGQNTTGAEDKEDIFHVVKKFIAFDKQKRREDEPSSSDSNHPSVFISDGSPKNGSSDSESSSWAEMGSPSSEKTRFDFVPKTGLFSWKRRRTSLRLPRKKVESLIENPDVSGLGPFELQKGGSFIRGNDWEPKDILSRDGEAKLKTDVFFASFDQRSERAAGQSACTALVAVIAHWFCTNKACMLTTSQFDTLITEGSSEWRKLCDNEAHRTDFPDCHFDLETVLKADLRPLIVLQSFTGIFSPDKFQNLKGATSFEDVWREISRNTDSSEDRIYIVSWNDHFFVLKVDKDAYYIIDSLGERLFEGCNQAYMLRFDESSMMVGKNTKEEVGTEERAGENGRMYNREESETIICKGKECCKEFIKRFLANIPLKELEEEEKKGTVSTFPLLRRLQIDFHYCSPV
ncbi:hypothetical protein K2173_025901 [Erythroxylum novogranatense]|uniref:C2 NT-type domain-containing protein n=1 Tax=Erythroxylum novogranatense TaxID=1862640 RepID=A0AAV8SIB3_9ROSI|nr:hypothetical protein K2173_025901 [Erythroxylum novogranatense]